MKDFNLFSIYSEKKTSNSFVYVILFIFLAVAVALPMFYVQQIKDEEKSITYEAEFINMFINSADIVNKLNEFDKNSARIDSKKRYADAIERSTDSINKIGTLSSSKIVMLADILPLPAYVSSFSYNNRNVSLLIHIYEREIAAELISLLKKAESVENVSLNSIIYIENEDLFAVSVFLRMKEGVL